jgi:hypothetical protein
MCIPVPCALTFTIWRTVNGSPAFVEYILSDGLILPEGCEAPTAQTCKDGTDDSWSDFSGSDSDEDDAEDDAGQSEATGEPQPTRPQFKEEVEAFNKAIDELGGEVFPKLMWSCPRDATWINAGENIRCVSAADIIMLLKSSDFIVHDLCHPFDCCIDGPDQERERGGSLGEASEEGDTARGARGGGGGGEGGGGSTWEAWRRPTRVVLALRKWFEGLRECMEFRCFVRDHVVCAISQVRLSASPPLANTCITIGYMPYTIDTSQVRLSASPPLATCGGGCLLHVEEDA